MSAGRVRRPLTVAAGTAAGGAVLFAPAADAATFQVTNLNNDGPGSLRVAVEDADASPGPGDVVTFQSGLSGAITLEGTPITIDEGVSIQGPGASVVTVDANDDSRVFEIDTDNAGDPGEAVGISGLTLANGTTVGVTGNDGGAIDAFGTQLTLSGLVIRDSYAETFGGGVHAQDSSLNITSTTMTGNEASAPGSGDGGAVYRDNNPYGPERIADSVFTNNRAGSEGTITLYDSYYSPVTIENTTVAGNEVEGNGGGIVIWDADGDAPITIRNSTITGNQAGNGGGVSLMFFQDPAPGNLPATVSIENTTVSGNSATYSAGGIRLYGEVPANVRIANSTVVNNTAEQDGGGAYLYADGFTAAITSTILAGNTAAGDGDEVFVDPDGDSGFTLGFSLVQGATDGAVAQTPAGSNLLGVDPQLGPLPNERRPDPDPRSLLHLTGDRQGRRQRPGNRPARLRAHLRRRQLRQRGRRRRHRHRLGRAAAGRQVSAALAQCKGMVENLLFAPGTAIVGTDANDVIVGTPANDSDQLRQGQGQGLRRRRQRLGQGRSGQGQRRRPGRQGQAQGQRRQRQAPGQRRPRHAQGRRRQGHAEGRRRQGQARRRPGPDKLKGGGGKDSEVQ